MVNIEYSLFFFFFVITSNHNTVALHLTWDYKCSRKHDLWIKKTFIWFCKGLCFCFSYPYMGKFWNKNDFINDFCICKIHLKMSTWKGTVQLRCTSVLKAPGTSLQWSHLLSTARLLQGSWVLLSDLPGLQGHPILPSPIIPRTTQVSWTPHC